VKIILKSDHLLSEQSWPHDHKAKHQEKFAGNENSERSIGGPVKPPPIIKSEW